jgi:hypothetical protein
MNSGGSSVDLTTYGLDGSGIVLRFPVAAKDISFFQSVQTCRGDHSASSWMGTDCKAVGSWEVTTHFYLVPRLTTHGAVYSLLKCFSGLHRDNSAVLWWLSSEECIVTVCDQPKSPHSSANTSRLTMFRSLPYWLTLTFFPILLNQPFLHAARNADYDPWKQNISTAKSVR